ncbi:GPW/gp25 family protein [Aliiglaciecola sp. CAU 1673]|uniref:GPW/gp25 family protein n=1 Tax=Aliiglaciecola sp. CAU 1673 TaxID=3032595 RepID=UPI0023DC43CC|nr:GPW/gp25 family protein [Aliiglaciecola sp. CAU 1673]MDF2177356.1 GPW/gp25 family protein [Aliiglaciecola sp. CAU 1673]
MTSRLNNTDFMRFPLTITAKGATVSDRSAHVREQIEQVLFTNPGERWYRPGFGLGVRALVFEPNSQGLWELSKKRLLASLSEALAGEVEPASLDIQVQGEGDKLLIDIAYRLATINHTERLQFAVGGD